MVLHTVIGIFIINFIVASSGKKQEWCYNEEKCGPANWDGECNVGKAQSPIDLTGTDKSKTIWKVTASNAYCSGGGQYSVRNTGHSVISIFLKGDDLLSHSISGDGFKGDYALTNIEVYWSHTHGEGTEHAINGKKYDLEIHFIHKKYDVKKKAFSNENRKHSVTAFALLYEIDDSGHDNPVLEPIIQILQSINGTARDHVVPGTYTKMEFIELVPKDRSIYRYDGSLTTPPCTEKVLWSVFKNIGKISKHQIEEFRSIVTQEGKLLSDVFRPLQKFNNRKISQGTLEIVCE